VAAVPAREPGVPLPSAVRGAGAERQTTGLSPAAGRRVQYALAGAILLFLAILAWHYNVKPRHQFFAAFPDTLRVTVAATVLFGAAGLGLVRLLLPSALRRYELLWILPTGGCAVGLTLTVLGFAGVPYAVSLALVLAGSLALSIYAIRKRGRPSLELGRVAWPLLLAFAVVVIALVPMLFKLHYAAPIGTGSDAHVAAGTAQFLKHSYPLSVNTAEPINRMPPTWRSKYPIYYAFAGVSSLSGLATWQVLPILAVLMIALAAVGLFLVAREVFCASAPVAAVAMAVAGLDRMAIHTATNPYFNQTWGYFAMPFTLVLGWWVVKPGGSRRSRQAGLVLLALFALVLAFAYPLALPLPAGPIVVFAWLERRRRVKAGEDVFRFSDLYRGRRSLIWIAPLCVALAVPVYGVYQKVESGISVLLPGHSLAAWGGDLGGFIPFNYFFSLPNSVFGTVLLAGVLVLAAYGLRSQPRPLTWGLGALLVIGLLLAVYLRHRQFGYYFEFKLLAFVGPLVLLAAVVGAARLGGQAQPGGQARLGRQARLGIGLAAGLVLAAGWSSIAQINATGLQLPQATIQLSSWANSLPQGASVRLDMEPPDQLWAAYFLVSRPLCSQLPLLGTDYAHVPISRKADYIVAARDFGRPQDAVGSVLRQNRGYRLYRENPAIPGPSNCSVKRLDRIYPGANYAAG
jgi:hypothetical protein